MDFTRRHSCRPIDEFETSHCPTLRQNASIYPYSSLSLFTCRALGRGFFYQISLKIRLQVRSSRETPKPRLPRLARLGADNKRLENVSADVASRSRARGGTRGCSVGEGCVPTLHLKATMDGLAQMSDSDILASCACTYRHFPMFHNLVYRCRAIGYRFVITVVK